MHTYQRSMAKRAAAFLLLALVLCVHMVKLLHVHEATHLTFYQPEPGYYQAGLIESACNICAFQWAKDAPAVEASWTISTLTYPATFDHNLLVSWHTAPARTHTGRGPPAA